MLVRSSTEYGVRSSRLDEAGRRVSSGSFGGQGTDPLASLCLGPASVGEGYWKPAKRQCVVLVMAPSEMSEPENP